MAAINLQETEGLVISEEHWQQMISDVRARAPEEACGLLGGVGCQVVEVIPVTNILHSPVRYRMAPEEQLIVFNQLEQFGYELVGIYHSHPTGLGEPSQTDIAESYYPDVVQLIWFLSDAKWRCRAYMIKKTRISVVPLNILNTKQLDT